MRVGVLIRGSVDQVDWAHHLGFRSVEWVKFEASPAAPESSDWKTVADELGEALEQRGVRLSAIGALYANPLDPRQTEEATKIFRRAFAVANYLQVKTVSAFPGAVMEQEWNERGGYSVYRGHEQFLPKLLEYWEPLAKEAADLGVRIAFEHCPQGPFHLPVMGYNMLGQPAMWERLFNETNCTNLGIEWDPSHLVCQFIDPLQNLRRFGSRIFHVHAKDAWIDENLLRTYGICHPGVAEHRFPGLGQCDWPQIVHGLARAGYDSDLNVEGWHDPVFRDHAADSSSPLAGTNLEEAGLLIARRTLEPLVV